VRGIDEEPVSAWLVANIAGAVGPFTFTLLTGGRSNLTFCVTGADGTRFVLRRPPLGHILATAHDMAREHRLIAAVGTTAVPVAPALGLCEDPAVNGAPFYVMGFVDGVVLDSPELGASIEPERRRPLAHHLVDVLAALHAVDIDAVGLGDLARREAYLERQLRRWSKQWEASKTREVPAVEEVARRLAARVPVQQRDVIAHGDYRLGNCMTDPDAARILAVLDWELCTLGDPLADLGYVGVWWSDRVNHEVLDPSGAGGYPPYVELVERYATATGLDTSMIDYYVAFGAYRLAVISEGVFARYVKGQMGDDGADLTLLGRGTIQRAEHALTYLGG
jgi:aminoglycoside phosphotransferase (APT) family kinase protein